VSSRRTPRARGAGGRLAVFTLALVATIAAPPSATAIRPEQPLTVHVPDLGEALERYGDRVGASVVEAVTRQRWDHGGDRRFIVASSIKTALLLAILDLTERTGRRLTDAESDALVPMITRSDNDAASFIFRRIGGNAGLAAFLERAGVDGWEPNPAGGWAWSTISPRAMADLLVALHEGRILTVRDREYAMDLLTSVVPDQRFGVGTTAPTGPTVAMKNGWTIGPDGRWAVNSSGIVTTAGRTYVVSVYTRGNASLGAGRRVIEQVLGAIATAMLRRPAPVIREDCFRRDAPARAACRRRDRLEPGEGARAPRRDATASAGSGRSGPGRRRGGGPARSR
jgi:beta-lactamase class A